MLAWAYCRTRFGAMTMTGQRHGLSIGWAWAILLVVLWQERSPEQSQAKYKHKKLKRRIRISTRVHVSGSLLTVFKLTSSAWPSLIGVARPNTVIHANMKSGPSLWWISTFNFKIRGVAMPLILHFGACLFAVEWIEIKHILIHLVKWALQNNYQRGEGWRTWAKGWKVEGKKM